MLLSHHNWFYFHCYFIDIINLHYCSSLVTCRCYLYFCTIVLKIKISLFSSQFFHFLKYSFWISRGDPIKGPVLTLYTKYPCPLCDVLKDELKKSFNHRFSALREVNIAAPENSKWLDLYKNDIPVLFLNGIFVCKHRLDHEKIDEMLKKYESK